MTNNNTNFEENTFAEYKNYSIAAEEIPDCSCGKPKKFSRVVRKRGERSKSMFYRIFTYFTCFTIIIMLILWLLQILFLQTFYQQVKIHQLYDIASTIEKGYGDKTLYEKITHATQRSDLFIEIEYLDNRIYATSNYQSNPVSHLAESSINKDYLKARLKKSNGEAVVVHEKIDSGKSDDAMVYASVLDIDENGENVYLFIYSPLQAVGSTLDILAEMLIIVTFISILFGVAMAFFISRRLARPINRITCEAEKLAKGDYETNFNGNGYAETEELAATLNYASDELSKADKLHKDLIANVSHDLKTPLTMVKSYAEMIRDISGENQDKRNKHLNVIINESDRLNDLVNDLTQLSKMQANVDSLDIKLVDLQQLARESIDSFSFDAEQNGFKFDLTVEGAVKVYADDKKLRQVFANLIGNAVRYSGEDKRIQIRLTEREASVLCEIEDHGQGVAEDEQDAIWDRYYKSSRNHSRNLNGTGLGLSIVKQIFILHNAKFGVFSKEQQGSTFWFELPKLHEN
ncbi:MAG: sensor histidine kinase [Anaerovoracaceae bacterium]